MSQMDPDRVTLDAYVDGELSAAEMTRIAALVAQRPDLRRYVENQERLRRTLQASFASVMNEEISEQLRLRASAFPRARKTAWRDRFSEFFSWRALVPAAGALALGLFVGLAVERFAVTEAPLLQSKPNGQTVARGELARVLSEELASMQNPSGAVRVGLSFRSRSGRDCRTFIWDGTINSMSGIACHNDGDWVVAALATGASNTNAQAQYQMAGAAMPDTIRNMIKEMIAGRPFDASTERAARASNWSGTHPR